MFDCWELEAIMPITMYIFNFVNDALNFSGVEL